MQAQRKARSWGVPLRVEAGSVRTWQIFSVLTNLLFRLRTLRSVCIVAWTTNGAIWLCAIPQEAAASFLCIQSAGLAISLPCAFDDGR